MKVLLSIKPEFVEQITNGNKKFEYRKKIFKEEVDTVVVYSNMPVGKLVGEFKIGTIIKGTPEEIWKQTYPNAGVPEDFFRSYFSNREEAFAIEIKDFKAYPEPLDPKEVFGRFTAPQSYMYIDDEVAK